jgi:hypothetical protein
MKWLFHENGGFWLSFLASGRSETMPRIWTPFLAIVAALINLIAIALYHDKQSDWLNGTAAALCIIIIIALIHFWHRRGPR